MTGLNAQRPTPNSQPFPTANSQILSTLVGSWELDVVGRWQLGVGNLVLVVAALTRRRIERLTRPSTGLGQRDLPGVHAVAAVLGS